MFCAPDPAIVFSTMCFSGRASVFYAADAAVGHWASHSCGALLRARIDSCAMLGCDCKCCGLCRGYVPIFTAVLVLIDRGLVRKRRCRAGSVVALRCKCIVYVLGFGFHRFPA